MSETKLFRLAGSAPVIDMRTGHNATLRPGLVVLSEDAHTHAIAALEAEAEALRSQVSELQSDANSWQSGYDKGREDGAKAADGWKAQHARDSAELRRLCAERDALAAELTRWGRSYREVHEPALREAHAYIQDLRAELAAARVLLLEAAEDIESWGAYASAYFQEKHDLAGCAMKYRIAGTGDQEDGGAEQAAIAAMPITATPAQEVPDHTEQHLEMAEQGERQEANQDVRALVEALEECAASLAWNCFGECRAVHAGPIMPAAKALDTARAALATHRQAQGQ
ncbi:hypothetical protein ACNJYG_06890 [Pseudomonas sp. GW6]